MSDESGKKDPSMEEILGSIRKIITEDSTDGAPASQPAADGGEDVLDLTEEVSGEAERVEPVMAAPAGEPASEEPRQEPVFGARPGDEALDVTPPDVTPPAATAQQPAPVSSEPPREAENVVPDTTEPVAAAAPAGKLVSDQATSATAASLGELSKAVARKSGAKLGVGDGNTVEDMVKEMMRPMLRDWLDENLPGIVERLVRREIQNLVDRSQDDD